VPCLLTCHEICPTRGQAEPSLVAEAFISWHTAGCDLQLHQLPEEEPGGAGCGADSCSRWSPPQRLWGEQSGPPGVGSQHTAMQQAHMVLT